mmetsp:Transcript_19355/g.45213  ORF Transcript_19355/g.45213 Transcript_19355/m.45213 type:complete len:268 (+) Transcript_19355:734-1537(+)
MAIEIIFLVVAPMVLAFLLLSECCTGKDRESRRDTDTLQEQRRGGGRSFPSAGVGLLGSIPFVGGVLNMARGQPPAQPQRAQGWGGGALPPLPLPHAQARPVRPAAEPSRPASEGEVRPFEQAPPLAYALPAQTMHAEPSASNHTTASTFAAPAQHASQAPPPAYAAVVPPSRPVAHPPPAYVPGPQPPPQPKEESTSVLLGKLAGKAVDAARTGASVAVSAARKAQAQHGGGATQPGGPRGTAAGPSTAPTAQSTAQPTQPLPPRY